jgi:hypothetical protein
MRSLADRARRIAELALRAVALAALAVLLWRAIRPPSTAGTDVARGNLDVTLARWTFAPAATMRAVLDRAPDPRTRDWARALARVRGSALRWSTARPIVASAVVAEPAPEPNAATRVRLAAAGREPISVGDEAGLIDTLPHGGAAELELAAVAGEVRVSGATFTATTQPRDSIVLRPVLVLGAAGWESKFTIAALEERGWRVASRVRVAPTIQVTQGPLGTIDTARYSAVVVLDSTAASTAPEIVRYARSGGGVVLAGSAARIAAVAALAPGALGRRVAGVAGAIASAAPRTGLGAFVIASPKPDAITLESRDGAAVVAARRANAGRVMQSGYDETWRWRMAGGDEAAAAHREWWSRLVGAVAYTPVLSTAASPQSVDETPLASLIDALGPAAAPDARASPRGDPARVTHILFALVIAPLLLEWASRRLRGAR